MKKLIADSMQQIVATIWSIIIFPFFSSAKNIMIKIYRTLSSIYNSCPVLHWFLAVLTLQKYIFPPLFYGCKTWSLILREEHGLGAFENRLLMGPFGPEGQQTGEWRRLHSEELHDLHSSTCFIRFIKSGMMRWAGHVAYMGKKRTAYQVLVGGT
jgi:hypothetical protein